MDNVNTFEELCSMITEKTLNDIGIQQEADYLTCYSTKDNKNFYISDFSELFLINVIEYFHGCIPKETLDRMREEEKVE